MSEIYKNSNENLNEGFEKSKIKNIEALENILNPDTIEKEAFLAEQTEKCCSKLNETFTKLFENGNTKNKKKYDFLAALRKTVENPVG